MHIAHVTQTHNRTGQPSLAHLSEVASPKRIQCGFFFAQLLVSARLFLLWTPPLCLFSPRLPSLLFLSPFCFMGNVLCLSNFSLRFFVLILFSLSLLLCSILFLPLSSFSAFPFRIPVFVPFPS